MCTIHDRGGAEPVPPFTSLFLDRPARDASAKAMVNTVLGPVEAGQLGVTLMGESLMYVLPGAEYAFDIRIDRAEVFEALAAKLAAFKAVGGGAIVDATGMFQGRDLRLYEALSRETGVHIIATTGQGPEAMLGGYFLTPQTNPPTPWPAQKFAELFGQEVNLGMVVPRLERRAAAGMICTAVTASGMTPTDGSLVRGSARAGATYGVPVYIRKGADALAELAQAVEETLAVDRVLLGSMDRGDAMAKGLALKTAQAGARVGIDHVGSEGGDFISDAERVALVKELIAAGHTDKIILSSSATGIAFGEPGNDLPFSTVLAQFVPLLQAAGVSQSDIDQILIANPAELLTVRGGAE